MAWIPDRYRELRVQLRPAPIEDEVDEELRLHLELRAAELASTGLSEGAAREEALRRFGDLAAVRAETCEIEHGARRERRRMELFDTVRRETRHSVRSLLRAPLFTLVAVLTLGLGLGATTATFTLLNSIVLRPLPYPESDRLVLLRHAVPKVGTDQKWGNSVASYFFYRENGTAFDELGAYSSARAFLSGEGGAELVDGAQVSASLLRVLGLRVVHGRTILDSDDVPGSAPVALIGHDLWQTRFGGDPTILGRRITLNSEPVTVIGVVEAGARLPEAPVDVWVPLQLDRSAPPQNAHWVNTYARLRPGSTPESGRRDLERLAALMPERFPEAYSEAWYRSSGFTPDVTPLRAHVLGRIDRVLWILLGAVAVVLLIACANVANLLLVRAETRRREQTVRAALGAERAHFAVHFLTESALLALAAVALGLLFAYAAVRTIVMLAPAGVPRLHEVALDAAPLAFAIVVAGLTALLFGLVPVLRSRYDFSALRESGRGMTASRERQRVRSVLVVGQVALALVLLAAGGLMARSFLNLRGVESGIEPDRVLTFEVFAPYPRYPTIDDQLRFRRELTDRILALPGVTHAAATTQLPLGGGSGCVYTTIEGHVYTSTDRPPCLPVMQVLPGYFDALGIRVTGQAFRWDQLDRAEGVAVVSRAFARRMWPGEDPIGRGVISYQDGPPWYRVIGIAEDVRAAGLDQPAVEAIYYLPRALAGACCAGSPPTAFVVRTSTARPELIAPSIRAIVQGLDAEVPIANVRTMREVLNSSEAVARGSLTLLLLGIAATMALFLSAVGLYGVIAYLVGQRRTEIGVRMALGARVSQVARLVLLQSLRLTAIGIVIGVAGALVTSRTLSSLLFEVSPGDPRVLVLVSAVLLVVALMASVLPARRAARTDPSEALRAD